MNGTGSESHSGASERLRDPTSFEGEVSRCLNKPASTVENLKKVVEFTAVVILMETAERWECLSTKRPMATTAGTAQMTTGKPARERRQK
jgi:hypothetical protein